VINERSCYMRPGQHLNSTGKENMAKKITSVIKYILHSDKTPIKGKWYKDVEIDSLKHQAPQDATSSDTKINKK